MTPSDQNSARLELELRATEGRAVAAEMDAAYRRGDVATVKAFAPEFVRLLGRIASLRIDLGEGGELLEFCQKFAATHGIDLSSVIGGQA